MLQNPITVQQNGTKTIQNKDHTAKDMNIHQYL